MAGTLRSATSRRRLAPPSTSLLLASLALTGCGGGSSSSGEGAPGSGDTTGAGDRVRLALTAPARTRLEVTTTSSKSVTVGGETTDVSVTTGIDVDAILAASGESFRLDVVRELGSFSPEELRPVDFELGRSSASYDANGRALAFEPDRTIHDVLALGGYDLVALTLSHPGTPVGVGDTWTERNALPSVASTVVTQVDALDDRTVSVSKRIDAGTDALERYTVSGEMSAVYSRPSLLLQSADITITLRYEDELYIDGVRQSIVDDSTFSQTIREAGT